MTALPIIETQAGDISAYIPTNVISITDGQLFLNLDQFNAGQRPAVDSGMSVSRVGSAAQTSAMKNVSASLKLQLETYYDMLSFAKFSSDIDESTKKVLDSGERITELLNQSALSNVPHELMIFTIFINRYDFLDELDVKDVIPFEKYLHNLVVNSHSELLARVKADYKLDDQMIEEMKVVISDAIKSFKVSKNA